MVERAQRQMPRFAGDVKDQAIGKTQRRTGFVEFRRSSHYIGILQHQVVVGEEHFHRRGGVALLVSGAKHPRRFGDRQN